MSYAKEGRGGLLLRGCAGRSLVDGNERNGRGRCSGRFSLRSGHRHVSLLLALVGRLVSQVRSAAVTEGDSFGGMVRGCVLVVFEVCATFC